MSKRKPFRGDKGLRFKYSVKGINKILIDRYQTIESFLDTEFPKNSNPMSPTNNTQIHDITWNSHLVTINENVKTVSDLKKILSGEFYCTNSDIRLTKTDIIRKSIHSVDEVRETVKDVLFEKLKKDAKVELDGDIIKGNSQRYQLFFTKGTKCACCGIEGKYFAKEKRLKDKSYHLNLYGVDDNGQEVLITKDHIIPKSKGGKDELDNYQTMCVRCNKRKGNKTE